MYKIRGMYVDYVRMNVPGMYEPTTKCRFHDAHSIDCDARGVARTGKIREHYIASLVSSRQEFGEGGSPHNVYVI